MKSLVRQRREQGAVCSVCRSPDYRTFPPNQEELRDRPSFQCMQCGSWWTYGKDGGVFAKLSSPHPSPNAAENE
jgi:hypothetical protein